MLSRLSKLGAGNQGCHYTKGWMHKRQGLFTTCEGRVRPMNLAKCVGKGEQG